MAEKVVLTNELNSLHDYLIYDIETNGLDIYKAEKKSSGISLIDNSRDNYPLFEIYSNSDCTERPLVNGEYNTLYVKVNKTVNANEIYYYQRQNNNDYEYLYINGAIDGIGDGSNICLYIDFFWGRNYVHGDTIDIGVYEVTCSSPIKINQTPTISFGNNNQLTNSEYPMLHNELYRPFVLDLRDELINSNIFISINNNANSNYGITLCDNYMNSFNNSTIYIPNSVNRTDLLNNLCLIYAESDGYNYIVPFEGIPYKQIDCNIRNEGSTNIINNIPDFSTINYEKLYYEKQYLTIEAITTGTVTISCLYGSGITISYSIDNGSTWTSITTTGSEVSLKTLAIGEKILFKGSNEAYMLSLIFGGTAQTKIYGNIMSLLYGDNFVGQTTLSGLFTFAGLFYNYANLISVENLTLPATILANNCYFNMFNGCTSLIEAPELPATTLAESCYYGMFEGCTSLITPPKLPATILIDNCYYNMFSGCTSLTKAPELPATTLAEGCYKYMFENCTSLTKTPKLPATTLAEGCYDEMFQGCTSLTEAPELPATTLAVNCYDSIFSGCISLVQAPELPATTLTDSCYEYMFVGCTSLIEAPELPATTLAESCYYGMFSGCESLVKAPQLPATIMTQNCYNNMFRECTSLIKSPKLPATTLADKCYYFMFAECASLIEAPELPATTLTESCYESMFWKCTSLTKAPKLPATTLVRGCYNHMFEKCTNLNYIKALFTTTPSNTYTQNWVLNVAQTGTFIKNDNAEWTDTGQSGVPTGWTIITESQEPVSPEYHNQYFTIEAITAGTVTIKYNSGGSAKTISYSTDNGSSWTSITTTSSQVSLKTLAIGEKILFKGTNTNYNKGLVFGGTARTKVYGNIMSLLYGDNFINQTTLSNSYTFVGLFYGYTNLISAENLVLPATILASYCYQYMFYNCILLKEAPELPATTLANYCYSNMFYGCALLVQAPELPATTLANYCYEKMFSGCTSLVKAPELPAITLTDNCYQYMFELCKSLIKAPKLPATTLADYCYREMFRYCTSLAKAPELPATTLINRCYYSMFVNCTSLTEAPELPATSLANCCYAYMFNGCTSLVQAPKLPATTLATYCYESMFQGCTSLVKAPKLPVSTLTNSCYQHMFYGCTSLTKAPELPATTLAKNCYYEMFISCTSLVNPPELPAISLTEGCYIGMFSGCTSLVQAPELPATTLANECYSNMFEGCTSLIKTPELPATVLANYCYSYMFCGCTSLTETSNILANTLAYGCCQYMFSSCTSLTKAPDLIAIELAEDCYAYMFSNCNNLNYIKALFTTTPSIIYTNSWVAAVSSNGIFIKNDKAEWTDTGINAVPTTWEIYNQLTEIEYSDYHKQYLTTEALEDGIISFNISKNVNPNDLKYISYSINDGLTWTKISNKYNENIIISINVKKGTKVLWKGSGIKTTNTPSMFNNNYYYNYSEYENYSFFSSTCKFNLYGNIMSLLYENTYIYRDTLYYDEQFAYLFYPYDNNDINVKIIDASNLILPATTLTNDCYKGMFKNCDLLKKAPKILPATTLAQNCYSEMFRNCKSLKETPNLPATILANNCYQYMFYNCTSLTEVTNLQATTMRNYCYLFMFGFCTSLIKAPELPATTLADYCYCAMFYGCTALTKAPELLATTLECGCYNNMFNGCTSLIKAPELPAIILAENCYGYMFTNCNNLNYIKALFISSPDETSTGGWVFGVSETGTFVKNNDEGWLSFGVNSIPNNWYIQTNNIIKQPAGSSSLYNISPNMLYILDINCDSSIALINPLNNQKTEYKIMFDTGLTLYQITFTNDIYWNKPLSIIANSHYEINIMYDPRKNKYYGLWTNQSTT